MKLCAMDTYRCIVTKKDLRTFTDKPIPEDVLLKILNGGRMSGSSRNQQPWGFVVVRDRERLATLAGFGRFAQHVASAAAAIAFVIDDAGYAFDAGRCAQNMMLTAWNFGVASCPATPHRQDEAKRFLDIPQGKTLSIIVSFGYPRASGRGPIERTALRILTGRGRRPLHSFVSWEQYGNSKPQDVRV
jgi:nitroreductase